MSRRRKHGDSPGLKSTLRKAAAAEECTSVVEPGKRRLRSARGSGLYGVADGPPWPMPQQEQPPAAASGSKSNPEGETWAARPLGFGTIAPQPSLQLGNPGWEWGWSLKSVSSLGFSPHESKNNPTHFLLL